MSELYRIERFSPDSERRFGAADAWMVDFEEGFAVVPAEPDMHEMQRTLEDLLDVSVPLRFVRAALISGGIVEADDE